MKRIKIICILLLSFLISGCGVNDNKLDNAEIYTTIYPVQYITDVLYGENSTINSIYPTGVNINDYKLTDKQIETYSSGDLFVYIGLGKEKDIAKSFINKNDKLLIIDSTYGLNYNNNIAELWLAPNNFLMLAKNIKASLNEYLDNTIKAEEINKKYDELYNKVSWVDAELRNIAREAKENDNNTLVVATDTFRYLEGYGFNVISLEEIELSGSENALNDIKNKFKNSKYTEIIKLNSEKSSDLVSELAQNYKAEIKVIDDIVTNDDSASDYISIQYENIAIIREILLN